MRRIIIFGVILSILCSMSMVCSAATSDNWIPNGSYDGTGKMPQFGSADAAIATGAGRTGDAWKMLCGPSGTYKSYAWTLFYTCGKNLELNHTYTFSFWAKASAAGKVELRSNNFKFKVITDGVEGTETNTVKLDLTTEYTLQTVKFLVSAVTMSGTTQKNSQLTFYLGNKSGYVMSDSTADAYAWVDDVSLTEEIAETPVTVGVVITKTDDTAASGSFECGSADGTIPQAKAISATISSGADEFANAQLFMAYYDADGRLKNVDFAAAGSSVSLSEITTEIGGKVKFFIFQNGTVTPLAGKTEVTIAN